MSFLLARRRHIGANAWENGMAGRAGGTNQADAPRQSHEVNPKAPITRIDMVLNGRSRPLIPAFA
ncbi:hypothetical protein B0G62_11130 [Paraburkholderia eburnea]|uniref:Uncharacterized protein n=1 Tax=Paraburkholderia eburnea TaxID=1189126 RepID=A0A2S4M3T1_9BURK|nr:hypothetical protein [Paraburkholderia eburnea]POR49366.1 hypothetical protein B0G62_11130 [Paraburkholderia eburnea]PRZ20004.1 hypothetical protein BX588_113147 [Paraburkholderia eburnea]